MPIPALFSLLCRGATEAAHIPKSTQLQNGELMGFGSFVREESLYCEREKSYS
jgi:hypothetical protein